VPRAAATIRRVTAGGWEIIDRWEASTLTMWPLARRGGVSGKTGAPLTPPMWLPVDEWATREQVLTAWRAGLPEWKLSLTRGGAFVVCVLSALAP
jgi:hypothetical protein